MSQGLSQAEKSAMNRLVKRAVGDRTVLRIRLQDTSGFVDDQDGCRVRPDRVAKLLEES